MYMCNFAKKTLLRFSSLHIKISPEKAVTCDSVFHFFSSAHWLCTKIPYAKHVKEISKARWYGLRSFTRCEWLPDHPSMLPLNLFPTLRAE